MERFAALRGDGLPADLAAYFDAESSPLSAGERGCYASHLALCQRIARGDITSPALILEDDVRIDDDLVAMIAAILKALPPDWDFVRLSNAPKRAYQIVAPLPGERRLIQHSLTPTSTGASLVSVSGARKFLRQEIRRIPIDQDLRRVWHWEINSFGVAPIPITPDVLQGSSIDALGPKGQRKDHARRARIRAERGDDERARRAWGVKEMGEAAWRRCEWTNFVAAFTPKKKRAALFARNAPTGSV